MRKENADAPLLNVSYHNPQDVPHTSHLEPETSSNTSKEIRSITFAAAWPQSIVNFCRVAIDFTTISLLGHLGTDELAGAAFASVLTNISSIFFKGIGDALLTLTAQAIGSGNPKLGGFWLQLSFILILLFSIPVSVIWWNTGWLLSFASDDFADVIAYAEIYVRYGLISLVPNAMFKAFTQWLNGQQSVRPTLGIHIFFVFYNLIATTILVHGFAPLHFSGLGFIGAPLASASTRILRGCILVWWTCRVKRLHEVCWTPWTWESFSGKRVRIFMRIAVPSALVGFVQQAQLVFITVIVVSLGKEALAAHSGMLNVFNLATCTLLGLTDAGSTTIGSMLGQGNVVGAKKSSRVLLSLMSAMAIIVVIGFLSSKDVIGRAFSSDPKVITLASGLAFVISIGYTLLSITFACYGTLQGQGRPHIAAVSMFFGLWGISVPFAYYLGKTLGLGLLGVWWGLTIGYFVMTLIMSGFVLKSDWEVLSEVAISRSESHVNVKGKEEEEVETEDEWNEEERERFGVREGEGERLVEVEEDVV